jgi:hypothetical protein
MAFLEYILVVLLGSAGTANPGATPTWAFTADAVTQPSGGTEGVLVQATGGSPGKQAGTGRKGRSHARRHHRTGHRRTKTGGDPDRPSHRQPQAGVGATRR